MAYSMTTTKMSAPKIYNFCGSMLIRRPMIVHSCVSVI